MRRTGLYRVLGGTLAVLVLTAMASAVGINPKERIDYWRSNYAELTPAADPRVAKAQAIFKRVLDAAGRQPGVVPRLFVIKQDPFNISLPIAIPDGWVIISKGTLDICYRDRKRGDDRLAFVLGHELAHHLKGDFWHMQFFQALEASKARHAKQYKGLAELRRIMGATDELWAKELHADERGIIYAAMAGFDTGAIVSDDSGVNFFQEWVRALSPQRVKRLYQSRSHPAPLQRAAVVQTRLRQVHEKTEVFDLGLRFYQAGVYPKAIRAFEHFLEFFPGREVYHNLAASHHQLALRYYRLWQPGKLPFKLSMSIDPETRANWIRTRSLKRGQQDPETLFHEHMTKAIEFYKIAIGLDPSYGLAHNNLGCALILTPDVFKAIGMLKDALKLAPNDPKVLNNLGAAFFAAELSDKAQQHLTMARRLAPRYDAPLFNLGKIADLEGRRGDALSYWRQYVYLDTMSPWTGLLRQHGVPFAPRPQHPTAVRYPSE